MVWDGYATTGSGDLAGSLVFFDDNHLMSPPLSQQELETGTYSKTDHYAVEWFEERTDGSWGAVISERRTVCMWPNTTISGNVHTLGEVLAASVPANQSTLKTPQGCKDCALDEKWYRYSLNIGNNPGKPLDLNEYSCFGGLLWEALKYIAGNRNNITPNGFTGPVGNNQSFSQGTACRSLTPFSTKEQIKASLQTQDSPATLASNIAALTQLATEIKSWTTNLAAATATRLATLEGVARPSHPQDPSECCSKTDIDYLAGCCPDEPCCGNCCWCQTPALEFIRTPCEGTLDQNGNPIPPGYSDPRCEPGSFEVGDCCNNRCESPGTC